MVNFLLRKSLRGNLNEAISANEIASFRFPRDIFLKRKFTLTNFVLKFLIPNRSYKIFDKISANEEIFDEIISINNNFATFTVF